MNGTTTYACELCCGGRNPQHCTGARWGCYKGKERKLQSPFLIPSSEGALGLLLLEAIDDHVPRLLPPLAGGEHGAALDRGRAHGLVSKGRCVQQSLMQSGCALQPQAPDKYSP